MAKFRLNSDAKIVAMVRKGLKEKGGYCPCRLEKTEENKCICEEFRRQLEDPDFEGYCHCRLYYKEKEVLREGFREIKTLEISEIDGKLHQMEHAATGLKLAWLERDEENKTFGIGFPTIPEDDTGVFHILEHSVLCGSDKYPVKQPFVEMLKTSLNTFLNAMTFPDKTVYPVSSRNEKDYENLIRIYLDAVFHPAILQKKEIFMQEGWHYEFDEQGNAMTSGVVLNEMRGVFSDPDAILGTEMGRGLFPDNAYGFVSGGDPKSIPSLTYEKYIETYKKHYCPANAYVLLDGDLPIDKILALLNEELSLIEEKGQAVALPEKQTAVDGGTKVSQFEISQEEDPEGRVSVAWGRVVAEATEIEKINALKILADALTTGIEAPLNQVILAQGLAESVEMAVDDTAKQTTLTCRVRNLREENLDTVEQLIFDTLSDLAENGIDPDLLDGALTSMEFLNKERDFGGNPSGIMYSLVMMDGWMYQNKPEALLSLDQVFENIRAKKDQGYFEQLIKEEILENPHRCKVVMLPSKTIGIEQAEMEAKAIADAMAALSEEEKTSMEADLERYIERQCTPDSEEALATLPSLTLADIPAQSEDFDTTVVNKGAITGRIHNYPTNGISYVNLYFPVEGLSEEEYCALSFLTDLLGEIGTTSMDGFTLMNRKRALCGAIGFELMPLEREDGTSACYFHMTMSALDSKLSQAMELALDILNNTDFTAASDITNILMQQKMELFQMILMMGTQFAINRVAAQYTISSLIDECAGGYRFYEWLCDVEMQDPAEYLQRAIEIYRGILRTDGMILSITGSCKESFDIVADALESRIESGAPYAGTEKLEVWAKQKEGIVIPADVSFVVAGAMIPRANRAQVGCEMVASKAAGLDHLWNAIRVQGGAYGAGLLSRASGFNAGYSFRDPNPAGSLKAYSTCADYLKKSAEAGGDLTGLIIGTYAEASPLLTSRMKGEMADVGFLKGSTYEIRCAIRDAILGTTWDDVTKYAKALEAESFGTGSYCVIGPEEAVAACNVDTTKILSMGAFSMFPEMEMEE